MDVCPYSVPCLTGSCSSLISLAGPASYIGAHLFLLLWYNAAACASRMSTIVTSEADSLVTLSFT